MSDRAIPASIQLELDDRVDPDKFKHRLIPHMRVPSEKLYVHTKNITMKEALLVHRNSYLVDSVSAVHFLVFQSEGKFASTELLKRKIEQIVFQFDPAFLNSLPAPSQIKDGGGDFSDRSKGLRYLNALQFELKVSSDTPRPPWAMDILQPFAAEAASSSSSTEALFAKEASALRKKRIENLRSMGVSEADIERLTVKAQHEIRGRPLVEIPTEVLQKSRTVYAGDIQHRYFDRQPVTVKLKSRSIPVVPLHLRNLVLCELAPGQSLHIVFYVARGNVLSRDISASPGNIIHRHALEFKQIKAISKPEAVTLKRQCGVRSSGGSDDNVFDIEEATGALKVARPHACTECMMCDEYFEKTRVDNEAIFIVETRGNIPPKLLFKRTLESLNAQQNLKQVEKVTSLDTTK